MTVKFLVPALLVCTAVTVSSQDDASPAPQSFLGYLKPGTHIGVQPVSGTADVFLHIYTDRNFETAVKLSEHKSTRLASEVAETNESVREELAAYIKQQKLSGSDDPPIYLMPLRASLATVGVVGADFILVESAGGAGRRRVIPKSRIGAIYLDATPVQFYDSSRRTAGRRGQ